MFLKRRLHPDFVSHTREARSRLIRSKPTLVVSRSDENLSCQLSSRVSIIHDFIATEVVIIPFKEITDLLHINSVVERSRITNFTLIGAKLPLQALNQVPNCHTTWNGVWIDYLENRMM